MARGIKRIPTVQKLFRCERCHMPTHNPIGINYGSWFTPQKVNFSFLCGACHRNWSEIFYENFGNNVMSGNFSKCLALWNRFMRKKQPFIFR